MSRDHRYGLTLVEVLLTMVLIAVLSAAVVTVLPNVLQLNRRSATDQATTVDAKGYFESLRADWRDKGTYDAGTLPAAPTGCMTGCWRIRGSDRRFTIGAGMGPSPSAPS